MRDYDAGRYHDAVAKLEEVTGISLNSFQGYYYLGLSYHAIRRYEDAVKSLGVALELEILSTSVFVAIVFSTLISSIAVGSSEGSSISF